MTADEAVQALALERRRADASFFGGDPKPGASPVRRAACEPRRRAAWVGERIDVAAVEARGPVVTDTPDVPTDAAADSAFMPVPCACRWAWDDAALMRGLAQAPRDGRHAGRTGERAQLGHRRVRAHRPRAGPARRTRGFGMSVLYNARHRVAPELEEGRSTCQTCARRRRAAGS